MKQTGRLGGVTKSLDVLTVINTGQTARAPPVFTTLHCCVPVPTFRPCGLEQRDPPDSLFMLIDPEQMVFV